MHPERAQDVRWMSALRGPEWNGDAAARCRRQRSMGIGEFPQQSEKRFRVTKALLAEEFDALTKRLIDAIAGYTDGGAPFGVMWEEVGIDPGLPFEEKVKLYHMQMLG